MYLPPSGLARFLSRLRLRESLVFAAHAAVIIGIVALVRPVFMTLVPAKQYEQPVIVWAMIQADVTSLTKWLHGGRFVTPTLLFLVPPTVLLLALRKRLRWTDFDHGKELRLLVMVFIAILTWAGSTFDYNSYLDRGHFVDRGLLVALAIASYFTPLAVPFSVKWAVVMLKEPYIPIIQDDFDLRSTGELLIVFSCFVWASVHRTFRAKHALFTVIACWASYYYAAGVAKLNIGPELWSWTFDDHVTNISVGSHVRGWLSFLPDDIYLPAIAQLRRVDVGFTLYTMVLELGALFAFFVHPKVARWAFLGCFFLNFGIFLLTGICFWKWMMVNLTFYFWLKKKGAAPFREITRAPLVIALGIALVFFSRGRDYFFPQTGVAWYDSRMVENYVFYVIGQSGKRYFLDPSYLTPMDIQWIQGRLCYATQERSVTGIYGVTRNYKAVMKLEQIARPGEAMAMLKNGRVCDDPKQRAIFDEFFKRYFKTINRSGRQHTWLTAIGRFRHLYVFPKGENMYDTQEPVTKIELWREVIVLHDDKLHKLETKLTHTVDIP